MVELRSTVRRWAMWQKAVVAAAIIIVAAIITMVAFDSLAIGAIVSAIVLIAMFPPTQGRSPHSER
jgi:hypothetical protein